MSTSAEMAEAVRVVAVRLREDVYSTDPAAQMLVHADDLEAMATRLDSPLTASDEAIEAATAAWWEAIKGCEGQSIEPAIRAVIEAALPLLKYEVQ